MQILGARMIAAGVKSYDYGMIGRKLHLCRVNRAINSKCRLGSVGTLVKGW